MPNFHPHIVAKIAPLLEADEEIWAVYPRTPRQIVVTPRRLFILRPSGPEPHAIGEFAAVHRVGERLVVLERRSGASIAMAVDPDDEHGLQALTVIGLLLASGGDPGGAYVGDGPPAAGSPSADRRSPRRRHRRWRLHAGHR